LATVLTPPALNTTVTTTPGCQNNTGAFAQTTITNGAEPYTYRWSNGQSAAAANNLAVGSYTVVVIDKNGCRDTAAFEVKGPVAFSAIFPNDTTILSGGTATLTVSSPIPGFSVVWDGDGQRLTDPQIKVSPSKTVTYAVAASFGNCLVRDSVKVTVIFEVFEMPNAFTPDGDQVNDQFGPVLSGYEQTGLQIWSRWGELIFNEPTARWDGTINGLPAPTDVYIYRVEVRKRDGTPQEKTGHVHLLR
jgi:gliding motility-associated-like protein